MFEGEHASQAGLDHVALVVAGHQNAQGEGVGRLGVGGRHRGGYLAGTFANAAEGPAADEVCAFYLPLVGGQ